MNALSQRSLKTIARWYRETHGLPVRAMDAAGCLWESGRPSPLDTLAVICQARRHALQEAVRWGEPYSFFLAPGVLGWVVPLVDQYEVRGAILGGAVWTEGNEKDREPTVAHLVRHGAEPVAVRRYLDCLPVWPNRRCQEAIDKLYEIVYLVTGWKPQLLIENKERHQQQRQIAEEIHRRKQTGDDRFSNDEEQMLLSLIRAADRKGARRILNRMLGRVFLQSANLTVIRARTVEMMGYLVRRAVEDSPFLEPILERNHGWMARVIEAADFEALAVVLRESLDDFMQQIYDRGYQDTDPRVRIALRFLNDHFREPVTLRQVAQATGMSPFRIARLVKEKTGRSIIRQVHFLRIQEARRLLEESDASCADIALEVGFCDQSYFTRQFKMYAGITPASHRRRARAGGALPIKKD